MTDRRTLGEFELIRRYLAPLATAEGALGLSDDAALLQPSPGHELVLAADAMVAGVHFLPDDPPGLVARKLLRVNLSDLAAMAATPFGYLMTTAWPRDLEEAWIADFAAGLAADQREFAVALYGGDTVATDGPISLSLTALGQVPQGRAVRRRGAREGDRLFVTGSIGDGALGLRVALGEALALSAEARASLLERYRLPRPRCGVGPALLGLARAMIDVSDGLVADAGHLAEQSGLGIELRQARVPLSAAAAEALRCDASRWDAVLTGGDDYELLFAAGDEAVEKIAAVARESGVAIAEIGRFVAGEGVRVLGDDGAERALSRRGWRHF